MVSSMALVVAEPAARLRWLTRRSKAERGNVMAKLNGNVAQAIQMSSGATWP